MRRLRRQVPLCLRKKSRAGFVSKRHAKSDRKPSVKKLSKSASLLYRWANKFDWKNRAIAWDNSLLEELRIKEKQNLSRTIRRQLKDLQNFQSKAADSLSQKDLSKASVKSLNEMYHSALQAHWTLLEKIGVTNSEENFDEDDVIIQVPKKNPKI